MSIPQVLFLDHVSDKIRAMLCDNVPENYELIFWQDVADHNRDQLLSSIDYILVIAEKVDQTFLSKCKKLRFIQKAGIGLNNIDLDQARVQSIPVSNIPGGNAQAVAELTILQILALFRKLILANEATKNGKWLTWELRPDCFEMAGKTHGIIGFGAIGQEVAKRSAAFGCHIVYYDAVRLPSDREVEMNVTYLAMEDLLRESDIISVHVPLIPETKHLIDKKELALMKPNGILINVSRGGVVNEQALYEWLTNGLIAGAGIDAWEAEPPLDNPLLQLPNVIATPHIGGGTRDTFQRIMKLSFENIAAVEAGNQPKFIANQVYSHSI